MSTSKNPDNRTTEGKVTQSSTKNEIGPLKSKNTASVQKSSECDSNYENVEMSNKQKNVRPIPESLLKCTKSSAARSNYQANKENKIGRKQYFRNRTQKVNTPISTKGLTPQKDLSCNTKNVAVSSFILPLEDISETEECLPDKANWDASAIELPAQCESNKPGKESKTGNSKTENILWESGQSLGNSSASTFKSPLTKKAPLPSIKKKPEKSNKSSAMNNKCPLGRREVPIPSPAMDGTTLSDGEKSELGSNFENIYDDYLISELMKQNASINCEGTCEQINREILDMWSALELLRAKVLESRKINEENKKMLEFYEAVNVEYPNIDLDIKKELPKTGVYLECLANALEQSEHHLKVLGAKVDVNDNHETKMLHIFSETLTMLSLENKIDFDMVPLENGANKINSLNEDLENSIKVFERCKCLLERLKKATIHATSLALSNRSELSEALNKDVKNKCIKNKSTFQVDDIVIKCTMELSDSDLDN